LTTVWLGGSALCDLVISGTIVTFVGRRFRVQTESLMHLLSAPCASIWFRANGYRRAEGHQDDD
jgi:hypothetical protein